MCWSSSDGHVCRAVGDQRARRRSGLVASHNHIDALGRTAAVFRCVRHLTRLASLDCPDLVVLVGHVRCLKAA
jgi:hypothetical protein